MANFVKNLFGGVQSTVSSVAGDADFADFATAVSPSAPAHAATSVYTEAAATATPTKAASLVSSLFQPAYSNVGKPYTAWYRVWERTTLADFYQELAIIPIILLVVAIHILGVRANRSRAKKWADANVPLLESEFAVVGNGETGEALKENGKNVFTTYATGRQNIACVDVKLTLYKRFNPLSWFAEEALALFFESMTAPAERLEATAYCFDGKEKAMLAQASSGVKDSSFDGFVWAIVHKDKMNQLRNDRYDLSLTSTKDHQKLPDWVTIMSESAEITDALLTPDLIKAVNEVGQDFEALIVSDQPIDAPRKLDDTIPKKRVGLSIRLSSNTSASNALFAAFLRMPDHLVSAAHFRPEAMRRVRATRDDEQRKIRKQEDDEKSEERRTQSDKLKKEERDRKLGRMSADEQKKFLQKERDAEQRKSMKKRTARA